ncbi:hypothetical protein E8E13_000160 [Curvularia kusanoi]|uniref:Uncharacterized protein n=1 Tax=Curvularia kusanoi TaxID=90978 RepID=A0A9P4T3G4_CURKU|nr:hypothetical protein E8E13_000160 [Curvularia kusanoi]
MAHMIVFTSAGLVVLLLALASNFAVASAAPSPETTLDFLLPHPNTTGEPAGEIECYALPYGAMGIISHLLTYWTIAWIGFGRVPLWPSKHIHQYKLDLFLAAATLLSCIPIATITIYRCRLSWHFILISVWKLVTSVSVALISIHRCVIVRQGEKPQAAFGGPSYQLVSNYTTTNLPDPCQNEQGRITQFSKKGRTKQQGETNVKPLLWLILFLAGTVVGMVGLCALLWDGFRDNTMIRHLTYGFAAVMVIVPGLVAVYWYSEHCLGNSKGRSGLWKAYQHSFRGAFAAFVAVFGFFAALYGDLVLGIVANNVLGTPSRDVSALYWVWFIAKRFPLLSF